METITIASLEPKEKLTFVVTTDGRKLRCWNNKIGELGLEQGTTYEVETESSQYGTHVTKAKRLAGAQAAARLPIQAAPPAGASFLTREQFFVKGVLEHYIANGRCEPEKLTATMRFILNAFRATWPETEHYAEAAE